MGAQTSHVNEQSARNLHRHFVISDGIRLLLMTVLRRQIKICDSQENQAAIYAAVGMVVPAIPVWLQLAALATQPSHGEGMWEEVRTTSQAAVKALGVRCWCVINMHLYILQTTWQQPCC